MLTKKFKQLMAASLSVAMLMGQIQYANAADLDGSYQDFSENDSVLVFSDEEDTFDEEVVVSDDDSTEDYSNEDASEEASDEAEDVDAAADDATEDVSDAEASAEDASNEDASSEASSDDAASEASSEDADEDVIDELTELPEGIVGMAEGYQLTDSEAAIKADALSHKKDYFKGFSSLVEGVDYAESEVVFLSDDEKHAEEVASAYAGTVKSYENGVAVIDLTEAGVTVAEAYACAFSGELNIPVVTPNYYFQAAEVDASEELMEELDILAGEEIPVEDDEQLLVNASSVTVAVIDKDFEEGHGAQVSKALSDRYAQEADEETASSLLLQTLESDLSARSVMTQLRTAAENKADIINMSFTGNKNDPQFQSVVNEVYASDITVVAPFSVAECENVLDGSVSFTAVCALYMAQNGHVSPADIKTNLNKYLAAENATGTVIGTLKVEAKDKKTTLKYEYLHDKKESVVLTATALKNDKTKTDISNSGVTYTWASSNTDVVTVSGSGRTATVTSRSAGSAKITVTARTSSMKTPKTASISIKVTGDKIVSSVSIFAPSANQAAYSLKLNKDNSVKSAVLYTNANSKSITVTAKQLDKSKNTVNSAPIWTSNNTKVAAISGVSGQNATITAVGKGKATITCAARDGSGKKASVTIEVKNAITSLSINGPQYVAPGATGKFTVTTDKNASAKTVNWSVDGKPAGLTITSAGQLKVDKTVPQHKSYTIRAKAADNGGKEATINVTILAKAKVVNISTTSLNLSSRQVGKLQTSATVTAHTDNKTAVKWTNSNEKVVKISGSGGSCTITAIANGSATITATAVDGSNKKASVKVKVITPVSGVTLTKADKKQHEEILAEGGSITFKPTIGNAYGTPSIKKLNYTFTVKANGSVVLDSANAKKIATSSGGKISAKMNALKALSKINSNYSYATLTVKAEAADGSGFSASKTVILVERISNFGFPESTRWIKYYGDVRVNETKQIDYYTGSGKTLVSAYPYEVTVGNSRKLVGKCVPRVDNQGRSIGGYRLQLTGLEAGETTVTARLLDGSNIKSTFTIVIKK